MVYKDWIIQRNFAAMRLWLTYRKIVQQELYGDAILQCFTWNNEKGVEIRRQGEVSWKHIKMIVRFLGFVGFFGVSVFMIRA